MATPASVNQRTQWGAEVIPGTPVPADRTFRATTVKVGPSFDVGNVRPSGVRFRTVNYVKKEWSEGTLEGVPCFNELPDFLKWALGAPSTTDNGDGTFTHVFMASTGTTRTLEIGDATAASQVPSCFIKGFDLGWGRSSGDATLKADIVGGKWADGVTLTADPVVEQVLPITGSTVSVYLSTERIDLGTQQLADALKVDFKTGDMRGPVWTLDATKPSLSDIVPLAMDSAQVEVLVKANGTGRALIESLRTTDTLYMRIEAAGAGPYLLTIDLAVQVIDQKRDDQDGVWAATVPFAVIEDETGFSHQFRITDIKDL